MPQRLAYTKTQRIYHIFWRAAPKHHQKVQIFVDKRPTFYTLTSAKYSHCGLCQPECRRAGKSSDMQVHQTLSNTMRMVWRPKHALKTAKQPGHATIALTVTQRPPCESMQIPKDNFKPKGLREAKETNNKSLLRHNQTLIASFTGEND